MDLYEALKNGTSIEELENAFRTDLQNAEARLKQEQEAKRNAEKLKRIEEENLAESRENLATAFVTYMDDFFKGKYDAFTFDDALKMLSEFEKQMKTFASFFEKFEQLEKQEEKEKNKEAKEKTQKPVIKISHSTFDDDIIRKFLDDLK